MNILWRGFYPGAGGYAKGSFMFPKVYLNGLKYLNLEIDFKDGMIADYSCTNFDTSEENRKFIRENVLHHHDTLPMGEFAIGTNTTAYVFADKYDIGDKLPILIAEKMGPHFAVGDTCYSHEEELTTFNLDGKAPDCWAKRSDQPCAVRIWARLI